MSKAIKILVVEDSEDDAQLAIRVLRRGGFEPQYERVESAAAMQAALKRQTWDAVVSDFNMPDFSGLDALGIVRATGLDIPFILVSGAIGEETAAQAIKAGASDYVPKENMAQLAPALERELKEAEARAAHRQARRALIESEARFRSLTEMSSDFYWESDAEHRLTQRGSAKPSTVSVFQRGAQIGERRWDIPYLSPDEAGWQAHRAVLDAHLPFRGFEISRLGADGTERHISLSGDPVFDGSGAFEGYRGIGTDITERKRAENALAQFKQTLDRTLDSIFMFREEDFRFIYVNDGAKKQVGYSEAELLRMTPLHIKPRFTLEGFQELVRPLLDGTQPSLVFETVHRHKDGHDFPVEIFLQLLRSEQRAPCFLAIARDITERKRADRLLRQITEGTATTTGEEFMRTLTRILAEALGARYAFVGEFAGPARDRVRVISLWNGLEHAEPFEYPLAGTPCSIAAEQAECFYPGGVQEMFPQDDRLVRLGVNCYLGIRLQSSKGAPLGLLTVMHTRKLEHEAIARSVLRVFAARASAELERLRSTEALERSEQRFAKMFRSSPLGVILTRLADGKVVDMNDALGRLLGRTRQETLGRTTLELGVWANASDRERAVGELRRSGTVRGLEHPVRRKSGETRIVQEWLEVIELEGQAFILGSMLDVTEARQAAETLRDSEAQMRLVTENLPAMIAYFDQERRVRYANRRYVEFFAGAGKDIRGWHLRQLLGEAYWATIEERIARVLAGEPAAYERELVRADGEPRSVALDIVPHRASSGEILGAYTMALDITERKRAEKKLRKRDAHLRLLTENIPAAVAYVDRDLLIQLANRRYVELFCGAGAEVIGRSLRDVVGERHWPEVAKRVARAFAGERVVYERAHERPDGERREIEVHFEPDRSPGGEIRGYYGFVLDITERKRAEESRARLAAVVETSSDAIVSRTPEGKILSWNRAAERIFGYSAQEAVGRDISIIALPEYQHESRRNTRLLQQGESAPSFETVRVAKDGRKVDVQISVSAVRDDAGNVSSIAAIFRDITERKRAEEALRRFRVALDNSADMILLIDRRTMRYVDVNETVCRLLGYSREEMYRMGPHEVLPVSREELERSYDELIANPSLPGSMRSEYRCKDGSTLPFESTRHVLRSGDSYLIAAISRDIRERLTAEQALRLRNRAIEASINSIMITEPTKDGQRIVYVNPAFERITGYSAAEVLGKNPRFLHGEDRDQPGIQALRAAAGEPRETTALLRNYRKDGTLFWNELHVAPVRDEAGRVTHFLGVSSDVTERIAYQAEIERQANFDSLTGLANRNLLADRLRQTIVRAQRAGRLGAVLYLDLDRFKVINDSLGHAMGDRVLTQVSWRLSEAVRGDDTVARTGGDEFVVVLADLAREEDVAIVAQKLLGVVAEPVRIDGHEFLIATSIGAAVFPRDGSDPDTLLKHADSALYRAKDRGRGGVAFFAQEMNDRAVNYFNLERGLRHALERGEFTLHYQPIISLARGEIVGAEALIRWRREPGKMVSPMDFIPIAEESGLIVRVGAWVLGEAAARARAWNANSRLQLSVAVNLSARQFRDPKLVEVVRAALAATGLEPRLLHLEITESTVMQNPEEAIAALLALREIGVGLSVDDFGTGYSSLSYLKRLPLNRLKVDRSFVKGIPGDREDSTITRAVIELAHNLELEVVAEGVETDAQRKFLLDQGCDYAQGYLFSKPIELEAFSALVNGGGSGPPAGNRRPRSRARKR